MQNLTPPPRDVANPAEAGRCARVQARRGADWPYHPRMQPRILPIALVLATACGTADDKTGDEKAEKKAAETKTEKAPEPAPPPEAEPDPAAAKAAENAKLPVEKIELGKLHEGYFADKNAWVGRKVEVTAIYLNTNTVKSGDEETKSLSITTDVENFKDAPGGLCQLRAGDEFDTAMQGSQLRLEASVKGDFFDDVELGDCHVLEVVDKAADEKADEKAAGQ